MSTFDSEKEAKQHIGLFGEGKQRKRDGEINHREPQHTAVRLQSPLFVSISSAPSGCDVCWYSGAAAAAAIQTEQSSDRMCLYAQQRALHSGRSTHTNIFGTKSVLAVLLLRSFAVSFFLRVSTGILRIRCFNERGTSPLRRGHTAATTTTVMMMMHDDVRIARTGSIIRPPEKRAYTLV